MADPTSFERLEATLNSLASVRAKANISTTLVFRRSNTGEATIKRFSTSQDGCVVSETKGGSQAKLSTLIRGSVSDWGAYFKSDGKWRRRNLRREAAMTKVSEGLQRAGFRMALQESSPNSRRFRVTVAWDDAGKEVRRNIQLPKGRDPQVSPQVASSLVAMATSVAKALRLSKVVANLVMVGNSTRFLSLVDSTPPVAAQLLDVAGPRGRSPGSPGSLGSMPLPQPTGQLEEYKEGELFPPRLDLSGGSGQAGAAWARASTPAKSPGGSQTAAAPSPLMTPEVADAQRRLVTAARREQEAKERLEMQVRQCTSPALSSVVGSPSPSKSRGTSSPSLLADGARSRSGANGLPPTVLAELAVLRRAHEEAAKRHSQELQASAAERDAAVQQVIKEARKDAEDQMRAVKAEEEEKYKAAMEEVRQTAMADKEREMRVVMEERRQSWHDEIQRLEKEAEQAAQGDAQAGATQLALSQRMGVLASVEQKWSTRLQEERRKREERTAALRTELRAAKQALLEQERRLKREHSKVKERYAHQLRQLRLHASDDARQHFADTEKRIREEARETLMRALDAAEGEWRMRIEEIREENRRRMQDLVRSTDEYIKSSQGSAAAESRLSVEQAIREEQQRSRQSMAALRAQFAEAQRRRKADTDERERELEVQLSEARCSARAAKEEAEAARRAIAEVEQGAQAAQARAQELAASTQTEAVERATAPLRDALSQMREEAEQANTFIKELAQRNEELEGELETANARVEEARAHHEAAQREVTTQIERLTQAAQEAQRQAVEAERSTAEDQRQQRERHYERELRVLQAELDRERAGREAQVDELRKAHERQWEAARRSREEEESVAARARQENERRLVRETESRVAETEKLYEARLAEERSSAGRQMVSIRQQFEQQLRSDALAAQERQHAAVDAAVAAAAKQAEAERAKLLESLHAKVQIELDDAAKQARESHQEQVQALEVAHQKRVEAAEQEWEGRVRDLQADFESMLAQERQAADDKVTEEALKHREQLAQLEARMAEALQGTADEDDDGNRARPSTPPPAATASLVAAEGEPSAEVKAAVLSPHSAVQRRIKEAKAARQAAVRRAEEAEARAEEAAQQLAAALEGAQHREEHLQMQAEELRSQLAEVDLDAVHAEAEASKRRALEQAHEQAGKVIAEATAVAGERVAAAEEAGRRQTELLTSMREEWMQERHQLAESVASARAEAERARSEKEQALQEAHKAHEEEMEALALEAQQKVSEAREEAEQVRQASLIESEAKARDLMATELERTRAEWQKQHDERMQQLVSDFQKQLKNVEDEGHSVNLQKLEAMAEQNRAKLDEQAEKARSMMAQRLQEARDEQEKVVQGLREDAQQQMQAAEQHFSYSLQQQLQQQEQKLLQQQHEAVDAALETAQSETEKLVAQFNRQWQQRMDETLAQKEEELTEAVMEVQAEAKRQAERYSAAIEAAKMTGEDERGRLLALADATVEQAVQQAHQEADAARLQMLTAYTAEWEQKYAEREEELRAEAAHKADLMRQQLQSEREAVEADLRRSKEQAVSAMQDELDAQRHRLLEDGEATRVATLEAAQQEATRALQEATTAAIAEREAAVQDALARAEHDKQEALEDLRAKVTDEHREAMEELHTTMEDTIGSIQANARRLQDRVLELEGEIHEYEERADAAEAERDESREEAERAWQAVHVRRVQMTFVVMRYIRAMSVIDRRVQQGVEDAVTRIEADWQARVDEKQEETEHAYSLIRRYQAAMQTFDGILGVRSRQRVAEHRTQFVKTQQRLAQLLQKRTEVETGQRATGVKKEELAKQMADLSGRLTILQDRIQESGGEVDDTTMRKKKQLDGQFESTAGRLREQKKRLAELEREHREVVSQITEAEEASRHQESQIFKLLIEQQTQMTRCMSALSQDVAGQLPASVEPRDQQEQQQRQDDQDGAAAGSASGVARESQLRDASLQGGVGEEGSGISQGCHEEVHWTAGSRSGVRAPQPMTG